MATLLIPLVGPLQSWGLDARFDLRTTSSEPSKSGVLGIVAAAMGRDRAEQVDDLAALRMGVRVDSPGVLLRDYHTAIDVAAAGTSGLQTVVSQRWYLCDAAFLCGLEGDAGLLQQIHGALADPVWPVFLGRKSCLPAVPLQLVDGLRHEPLRQALTTYPSLTEATSTSPLRLLIEDPTGPQERPDLPSAPYAQRQFTHRRVRTEFIQWKSPASS
jgi:CRISPR system Cascade subunit CasD